LIAIQAPLNSQSTFEEKFSDLKKEFKTSKNFFKDNFSFRIAQEISEEQDDYSEEINDIENLVEELFDSKINNKETTQIYRKLNDEYEEPIKKDFENNENNKRIKSTIKLRQINEKLKKNIENKRNSKKIDALTTPKAGNISVGKFEIPTRGYIELEGPNISIKLVKADAIETLKFIAEKAGYGIVIMENKSEDSEKEKIDKNTLKVTANFKNQNISDAFNSILMASNLQAKLEKNIIFIGENIFNKTLNPKFSKTYRLNQANAASVANYLSTLGANISKVLVKGNSVSGEEIGESEFSKADLSDNFINSYGIAGGPLTGLIGTVDLRLQTITLIGSNNLISIAEKYIKSMDVRHRQVALSIKIIDVSLTKTDLKNNAFELRTGNTYLYSREGMGLVTGNTFTKLSDGYPSVVPNIVEGGMPEGNFMNWLFTKIKNENAKVMASPTLILGENSDPNISGAAAIDDALGSASIGRPFSNEGFIKVGETVVVNFQKTVEEGSITCVGEPGTAGITFGAKLDKIDDNGYVTFALSPAISSVTRTQEIAGCGIQSILSVRKLDTGSIRVKDGDTLLLTGVLKDEDNFTTSKTPLLGDIPILGRLFRQSSNVGRKSELIILVTPKIINEDYS